jgi:hypothetical protein
MPERNRATGHRELAGQKAISPARRIKFRAAPQMIYLSVVCSSIMPTTQRVSVSIFLPETTKAITYASRQKSERSFVLAVVIPSVTSYLSHNCPNKLFRRFVTVLLDIVRDHPGGSIPFTILTFPFDVRRWMFDVRCSPLPSSELIGVFTLPEFHLPARHFRIP